MITFNNDIKINKLFGGFILNLSVSALLLISSGFVGTDLSMNLSAIIGLAFSVIVALLAIALILGVKWSRKVASFVFQILFITVLIAAFYQIRREPTTGDKLLLFSLCLFLCIDSAIAVALLSSKQMIACFEKHR